MKLQFKEYVVLNFSIRHTFYFFFARLEHIQDVQKKVKIKVTRSKIRWNS